MQAGINAAMALGHQAFDVSAQQCGWDITSQPPSVNGKLPLSRHIEVKGRGKGASTITVTRNEILYGLNKQYKFILATVLVDGAQGQQREQIRVTLVREVAGRERHQPCAYPEDGQLGVRAEDPVQLRQLAGGEDRKADAAGIPHHRYRAAREDG